MRNARFIITAALTALAIPVVGGCAGAAQVGSADAGAPRASSGPSSAVSLITYRCKSDALIRATYPTDAVALLRYRGETHQMQIARAASGVRYIGDGLQWWTKGNGPGAGATLWRVDGGEDADGEIIETCSQVGGTG